MTVKNSAATYPYPRPSSFFMSFMKLLAKEAIARDIGRNGLNLLRIVVTKEDSDRFIRPAIFTDRELLPLMDVTEKPLVAARERCIQNGWLVYHPGSHRRTASRAWVTVPTWVDDLFPDKKNLWRISTGSEESPPNRWRNSTSSSTEVSTKDSPSLIPIPSIHPPPLGDGWAEVENKMLEIGIQYIERPIRVLKSHGVDAALALLVIEHSRKLQNWTPQAIRERLMRLRPGQEPTSLWPKGAFNGIAHHPAIQRPTGDLLKERDAEIRQLELEFEPELKGIPFDEIINHFPSLESLKEELSKFPSWAHTSRSPPTRLKILRALKSARSHTED